MSRLAAEGTVRRPACGAIARALPSCRLRGPLPLVLPLLLLIVLPLLVLLLAGGGCSERDHSNPFDPDNPDTQGQPALLHAIAGDREVELRWNIGDLEGIRTVEILRRDPGGAVTSLVPSGLDPVSGSLVDPSVQNGTEYAYRLRLQLDSGTSQETEWDLATPGTTVAWVADADGGGLVRISPDGRDVVQQRLGGSWVLDAVADSASSSVWSADYLLGAVREHSWDGELLREFEALGARAVAVPPVGGGCWVALYPSATLERRTGGGQLLWADSTAGHVEDLLSLPAQFDERLWAVNSEGQANVYRDQERQTIEGFTRPVALARSGADDVLLLDRGTGRVHRYDPSGEPKATSEALFADAVDICRDGGNGAWVADPGRAQVIHLDAGLAVIDSIAVDGVLGLAWDDEQGKLWTVGLSGLRVFGESGERTASLSLGPRPVAIAILHISRR